jgi:hypothetical protein
MLGPVLVVENPGAVLHREPARGILRACLLTLLTCGTLLVFEPQLLCGGIVQIPVL